MTYSEKLKDPRWQKKRLAVMQRANFKCEACSRDNETLHVHHLVYPRGKQPWEVEDKWLECLCETCHGAREEVNSINRAIFEMKPTREVITETERSAYLLSIGEIAYED
jgi:5-methylcytosine-specific restriction endonuclease McrA